MPRSSEERVPVIICTGDKTERVKKTLYQEGDKLFIIHNGKRVPVQVYRGRRIATVRETDDTSGV